MHARPPCPSGLWTPLALFAVILALVPLDALSAPIYAFTKIADHATPIPGGPGDFAGFGGPFSTGSSMSDGTVAFVAPGPGQHRGLYTASADGPIRKLAETGTVVTGPAGPRPLTWFGQPSIDGSTVVFAAGFGTDPPTPFAGAPDTALLAADTATGTITILADDTVPVPGGQGNFTGFFGGSAGTGQAAFLGFDGAGRPGIYLTGALGVVRIADTATVVPTAADPSATNTLAAMSRPVWNATFLAFCAVDGNGNKGIYVSDSQGNLHVVADRTTPVPGGTGTFTDFGVAEGIDTDGSVAFVGYGPGGQEGIYSNASGALRVIANQSTPVPGSTGTFEHFNFFGGVGLDKGVVVFMGAGPGEDGGLYVHAGGETSAIIQHGDRLDGFRLQLVQTVPPITNWWNVIPPVSFYTEGQDRTDLAFLVGFSDGTSGIYVARAVPEPAVAALFVALLAGGACGRAAWRRTGRVPAGGRKKREL